MTMRIALLALVTALVTIGAASGCKGKDALYCCTLAAEDCDGGQQSPCTDPERSYCDNLGEHAASNYADHTCIADPGDATACESPLECTDPDRPLCVEQRCVECAATGDCGAGAPTCGDGGACQACAAEDDCARFADAVHCGAEGACVACRDAADCGGATPVCDGDACRACSAHAECASKVCDAAAGACVAEADVIYVDRAAAGDGACTAEEPCKTIQRGVTVAGGTRKWVQVAPGTYPERVTIEDKAVWLVADGATLQPEAIGAALAVGGAADVVVEGLTIRGADGDSGDGLFCATSDADQPAVRLVGGRIESCAGKGIEALNCSVVIETSTITRNVEGGLSLNDGVFSVVNNVIAQNGGAGSTVGGALLTGNAESRFEHNTVTANVRAATEVSGVTCAGTVSLRNNIIYANSNDAAEVSGECAHRYSIIGPQAASGDGNSSAAPVFVNPLGDQPDYHLEPISPGIDEGEASDVATDVDGERRPRGDGPDIGADEDR